MHLPVAVVLEQQGRELLVEKQRVFLHLPVTFYFLEQQQLVKLLDSSEYFVIQQLPLEPSFYLYLL